MMFQHYSSKICPILAMTALAATVSATGCNFGPTMAPVTGKVTYQGKAVAEGTVTFYPVAGGRPSTGKIQSDGTYELSSSEPGDGAVVGEYKVAIEARRVSNAPPAPKTFQEELAMEHKPQPQGNTRVEWLVPEEFSSAETSGLTATVEDKSNVINFDLP